MVLKLKTADFRVLTRGLTRRQPIESESELAQLALEMRDRLGLPATALYRLAGVGLSGFDRRPDSGVQAGLFA